MIELGNSAFLFIIISILVGLIPSIIAIKLIDKFFNTSLITIGVYFLVIISIEILTAY